MDTGLVFFIDKSSYTFADSLLAYGWMTVLADLHYRQGTHGDITLIDDGPYYRITMATPIQPRTLDALRAIPLWPRNAAMIRTPKNADQIPPDALHVIDYEEQKARTSAFYEARRKGAAPDAEVPEPHPHWDTFRAINPAALPGYNGLLNQWWAVREAQPDILRLLFDLFSTSPNDLDAAAQGWKTLDKQFGWGIKPGSTGQQLYNPDQGKGQNKTKSSGISIGNLDGFWLTEWLKLVGFYETAMTRTVRGVKDRKTYVVVPRELSFAEHRAVFSDFLNSMQASETSVRGDALAAIRYTRALLQYFSQPENHPTLIRRGNLKRRLVAGLQTAFYKDLGNAVATMNLSFIGLPGWIEVRHASEIPDYQMLLRELEEVVKQFDESHSDTIEMLKALRDFISGDELTAFFHFTNAFPGYLIGQRERGGYVYPLTTEFVERIIAMTEPQYSDILADPGFQNIAYAIRQSTVIAQHFKKQGKYDIRYGLGQELARRARYKAEFIAALSDFLFKYNAENAQVREVTKGQRPPYRRSIQTSDIDRIVRLIDQFDAQTVANLLIAYGYARETRDTEATPSEPAPAS